MGNSTPEQKTDQLIEKAQKDIVDQNKENEKKNEEKEIINQSESGLNTIEKNIVHEYFAGKMGNKFSECSKEEKAGIEELSGSIFKRIKKLQRVPLDITINSWIGSLMSIFQSKSSLQSAQQEKINQISSTVEKIEGIKDQFDAKISGIMTQIGAAGEGMDFSEINQAFAQVEAEIKKLKGDKDTLKEAAKSKNMSVKAYYQSQTRALINKYVFGLLSGGKAIDSLHNTNVGTSQPVENLSFINEEDDGDEFKDVQVKADDNLDDLKYTSENDMLVLEKIKSHPFLRNPKTKTTLCSQTARLNVEQFLGLKEDGLKSTQYAGHAIDVQNRYGKDILVGNKIGEGEVVDIQNSFTHDVKGNYFDIFTASKNKNGHRLVGFRSEPSNKIYVMDPYRVKDGDFSSRNPILIEDYIKNVCDAKNRPILKIVGYNTKKKVVDNQDVIAKANEQKGQVISINGSSAMKNAA